MNTRAERVAQLRPIVLKLLEQQSLKDVADLLGVSIGAVRNLKNGSTPQEGTLARIEQWARESGTMPGSDGGGQGGEVDQLDEWVRDFERRVRNVGGKVEGISEYERRARMSDAVEAQIQALQMIGDPVPPRLYELREMLRRGEI